MNPEASATYRAMLLRSLETPDGDYINSLNMATGSINFTHEERAILETMCSTPTSSASTKSEPDETPPPPKPVNKQQLAVQRHRKRRQNEFAYLKQAVVDLQAQLVSLNQSRELRELLDPPSRWEKLAKEERKRGQESVVENKQLKEAIEEQVQFAECLVNIVRKKPRLAHLSTEQQDLWKQMKLVADPAIRSVAIHAILDREFEKIDSAFIEAGLLEDDMPPKRRHVPRFEHGMLEIETTLCAHFEAPCDIVTTGVWDVFRGLVELIGVHGTYAPLTVMEDNVAYIAAVRPYGLGVIERRILIKKYSDVPGRAVFVTRGIHEDECFPVRDGHAVTNEVSWTTVEVSPTSPGVTIVKHFQKLKPALSEYKTMEEAVPISKYIMEAYSRNSIGTGQTIREYIAKLQAAAMTPSLVSL
ncbi:hypothetical protein SPRG_11627 [Saprolegnia parasitica CBS 223.65]|uniref:START domain-containing protein n=1 Tax=Saprolegnia parasitica (strain CBS 223.65) TaxID=695850 RepID=A0A067BYH5_SAPPC|nr:hypothetical protein SPRG_11627 [Saprolegnia parasitica CBS 223.65]KDO23313.1 hypothetical protein SPRG_11627 [Saprolegnia parasitica CBS 223.65]|eukprot:XP_012205965.1 hypothetical protein SPRG_11627 [Saprolegnia parasitica CBS 223.65]